MKVTSVTTHYTNCTLPSADVDRNYIGEFGETVTEEEKKASLYADWSEARIGEMLQAFINQYVAWCPNKDDLKMDVGLQLAHTLVKLVGHGSMDVTFEFSGTREDIRKDKFHFLLQSYASEELVPSTADVESKEPTVTTSATVEEGEPYEHKQKYATYFEQKEALGRMFKSLAPQMTKDNQIEFIKLVTFLVIEAEVMCERGAAEFEITAAGLSYADEKDEAKIKFLDETTVRMVGHKEALLFDNYMGLSSTALN